jgi:hypothetical protein
VVEVSPPAKPPVQPSFTGFSLPIAPNPSHGRIRFALSIARRQSLDLSIYDLAGRRVATLCNGVLEAGNHPFEWDGVTTDDHPASAGIYLVRFRGDDLTQTRRVCLLR